MLIITNPLCLSLSLVAEFLSKRHLIGDEFYSAGEENKVGRSVRHDMIISVSLLGSAQLRVMSNFYGEQSGRRCQAHSLRMSTSLWMFQVNLGIGWTPPPITADEIVKKEDIKVEEDDAVTAKGQRKIQGKKRD